MKKMQKDPYERDRARNKLSDAKNARGDDVRICERFEKETAIAYMNVKNGKAKRRVNTARSLDFSWGDGVLSGFGAKLLVLALALVLSAAAVAYFLFLK